MTDARRCRSEGTQTHPIKSMIVNTTRAVTRGSPARPRDFVSRCHQAEGEATQYRLSTHRATPRPSRSAHDGARRAPHALSTSMGPAPMRQSPTPTKTSRVDTARSPIRVATISISRYNSLVRKSRRAEIRCRFCCRCCSFHSASREATSSR